MHAANVDPLHLPLTSKKVLKFLGTLSGHEIRPDTILTRHGLKRNSCVIAESPFGPVVANIEEIAGSECRVAICQLFQSPFAIFECKRVGIEEGMKKGPQTIEKAKQGAYVVRSVSSLQKVRLRAGQFQGIIERSDGTLLVKSYDKLLQEIIDGNDADLLRHFILTVGVVSNHGNWFTSSNPNKELRVLAQSYDWLLFLTDVGLANFIEKLLLQPTPELAPARTAFLASYAGASGKNRFTKVRIDLDADAALRKYFTAHETEVESWFNVISPRPGTISKLRSDVQKLARKKWKGIRQK